MAIANLFVVVKSRKQPRYLLMSEQLSCVHTVEYYLAIIEKDIEEELTGPDNHMEQCQKHCDK